MRFRSPKGGSASHPPLPLWEKAWARGEQRRFSSRRLAAPTPHPAGCASHLLRQGQKGGQPHRQSVKPEMILQHCSSPAAPPAAPADGPAHGRSPGSRRIAGAAFPGGTPSGEDASARRSQSRGRPRIGKMPAAFPFDPHSMRGTVRFFCFSFAGDCQMRSGGPIVSARKATPHERRAYEEGSF